MPSLRPSAPLGRVGAGNERRIAICLALAEKRKHPYYAAVAYTLAQESGDEVAADAALALGAADYRPQPCIYGAGTMQPYYQDERAGITIFNCRCEDILFALSGVNLVLTDSPYGTTQLEWDVPPDWSVLWPLLNASCTSTALQVLFSAHPFTFDLIASNRVQFRYELIWHKALPTGFLDANKRPLRAHENILVFADKLTGTTFNPQKTPCKPEREHRASVRTNPHKHWGEAPAQFTGIRTDRYPQDVLYFSNGQGGKNKHETEKPIELMMWLVASYSNPGDLILDPFMGSGSTLEAAKRLGRRAIGIDTREECCREAVLRLQQEVMELI